MTPFNPSYPPAQITRSLMRKGSVATVLLGLREEKFVESSTSFSFYFNIISLGLLPNPAVEPLSILDLELA